MSISINLFIFILLVFAIVIVTKNIMIYNIRKLAIYLKWKNHIVGQLLGYATSTPELINAIVAGSVGLVSASIYNVISANIVNILSVIIVTGIFKRYKSIVHRKFKQDYIMTALSIIVPVILIIMNIESSVISIPILLSVYVIYIVGSKNANYFAVEKEDLEIEEESTKIGTKYLERKKINIDRKKKVIKSVVLLAMSLIMLFILGSYLGNILERLGKDLKVPGFILGIIMGFVTSIPELVTFVTSYRRHRHYKHVDFDIGAVEVINNMTTSNISNLALIQSIAIICYLLFGK